MAGDIFNELDVVPASSLLLLGVVPLLVAPTKLGPTKGDDIGVGVVAVTTISLSPEGLLWLPEVLLL